jgi:ABC-type sulfate transport system permease component
MPLAIIQAFEGSTLGLDGAVALSIVLLGVALLVLVGFRLVIRRAVLSA